MGRGLSEAAKNYNGPIIWAAEIRLPGYLGYGEGVFGQGEYGGGTVKHYAEDRITFPIPSARLGFGEGGFGQGGYGDASSKVAVSFEPYLRVRSGIRHSLGLAPDVGEIELLNVDLAVDALLRTKAFEGAECTLWQFLVGIEDVLEALRGRIQEEERTEETVRFRLVSELDPAQRQVAARPYQNICPWWFGVSPCGYKRGAIAFVENLAEQTADIFSINTIGKSTLSEGVDAHQDRTVVISAGTGKGQARRIKSNTATTFTLYGRWKIKPDATTKFKVFTLTNGAAKVLFTSTTGKLETTATSGAARTITDTGLAMTVDEHKGDIVRIVSGAGGGQERKIGANDGTRLTLDSAEPDFAPVPDATSLFRVLYGQCPKDLDDSCENRARVEDFGGFPTVVKRLQGRFGAGVGEFEIGDQGQL